MRRRILLRLSLVTLILCSCKNADYKLQRVEYYTKEASEEKLWQYWDFIWNEEGCITKITNNLFMINFLYVNDKISGTEIYKRDSLICKCYYIYDSSRLAKVEASYYDWTLNRQPTYWIYEYEEERIRRIIYDTSDYAFGDMWHKIDTFQRMSDSLISYLQWDRLTSSEQIRYMSQDLSRGDIMFSYRDPTQCTATELWWKDNNVVYREDFYRKYYINNRTDQCEMTKPAHYETSHVPTSLITDNRNPFQLPQGVGNEFRHLGISILWSTCIWDQSFILSSGFEQCFSTRNFPTRVESGKNTTVFIYSK